MYIKVHWNDKLKQIENRHKNEVDEIQRRYDQMSNEREKLAKQLREVIIGQYF